MAAETEYKIDAQGVFKVYPTGDGGRKTVLNDVNLRVRGGELVTVVGPSGCGKSTLLRLILGSEGPTEGQLLVDGKAVDGPSRQRGIVFQKYSLFPHYTVLENVVLGLDLEEFSLPGRYLLPFRRRRRRKDYRDKAMEYLTRMRLAEAAEKYPHQLSGGMMQRVAIAQAAIMAPDVLLMDEPFGALDDTTRQEMQLYLLELWEQDEMTILFVTHDLEEALFLGTRVIVLSQYFTADEPMEGAKIVADLDVPGGHPKPSDFKYSAGFGKMLEQIRSAGLEAGHRQHVDDFDLTHRDAWKGNGS